MPSHIEAITLFRAEFTTDKAAYASTNRNYSGRRLARLKPPYRLSWTSEVGAGGVPTGTISLIGNIQDSDDGTTWTAVSGWTVTAITAAAARTKWKSYSAQVRAFVRVVAKTIAAGTWGAGQSLILTAVLYGEVD